EAVYIHSGNPAVLDGAGAVDSEDARVGFHEFRRCLLCLVGEIVGGSVLELGNATDRGDTNFIAHCCNFSARVRKGKHCARPRATSGRNGMGQGNCEGPLSLQDRLYWRVAFAMLPSASTVATRLTTISC